MKENDKHTGPADNPQEQRLDTEQGQEKISDLQEGNLQHGETGGPFSGTIPVQHKNQNDETERK